MIQYYIFDTPDNTIMCRHYTLEKHLLQNLQMPKRYCHYKNIQFLFFVSLHKHRANIFTRSFRYEFQGIHCS